jgi:uncharacterized protein (DUF4213/DUF364 family)
MLGDYEMLTDEIADYALRIIRKHNVHVRDYGYGVRYSFLELCIDEECYLGVTHTLINNLMGKPAYMGEIEPHRLREYVSSIDPYLKQIGHEIINAVGQYLLDTSSGGVEYGVDPSEITVFENKRTVFIGDVRPLVDHAINRGGEVYVFEADPCRRDLAYPEFYYYRILGEADNIFISGSALTNESINEILRYVNPDANIVLIGPSASIPPEPLRGTPVKMIAAMKINPSSNEKIKRGIIRGGGTRFISKNSTKYIQRIK